MFNVTLADNQKVMVQGSPRTQTGNPAAAFNFTVINPNPDLHVNIAASFQPNFEVIPTVHFFGPDRVYNLTIRGFKSNQGGLVETPITVTVTGSLPDDGTLDHFEPTNTPPVAQ